MTFVVDTNVAIVANGHADNQCLEACIRRLESLITEEITVIDDKNLIFAEYSRRLNFSGQPGVGDMFFRYVFDNQYWDDRIRRVTITPSENERRSFEELPENTFDRADRMFLAVAVVAKATVLNATDSDWKESKDLMDQLGVKVEQLCPQHAHRER